MPNGVHVCLCFDFDAMSSWIATYRTKSPNALSRGEFGRVGAGRILDLLREYEIPSTWFVPGHTAEAFPEAVERVVAAGHEIGHHGYCHEDPHRMALGEANRAATRPEGRRLTSSSLVHEMMLEVLVGRYQRPRCRLIVVAAEECIEAGVCLELSRRDRKSVRMHLAVGVEEQYELAPRLLGAQIPSPARPQLAARLHHPRPGLAGDLGGGVGRAIVDDDELPVVMRLRTDAVDRGAQAEATIESRQNDADQLGTHQCSPLPGALKVAVSWVA